MNNRGLIDKLNEEKKLSKEEWRRLIADFLPEDRLYAQSIASEITEEHFGNRIYVRGLIEFSNICKNDCLYCGIRCSNTKLCRYRLTEEDILSCCREGCRLSYRTFVLQSGESAYVSSQRFINLIKRIKYEYPDCAVTLSVGEQSRKTYEEMYAAGAERYLLRHETACKEHYEKLHPEAMSFDNRMRCLRDLRETGFQTGCGMMVGTPFQTPDTLADDMLFMEKFCPHMAGIGPFIPHKDTPFARYEAGSRELTLFLLSLTRIMLPDVLLPATTALGSLTEDGRIQGVLAGCNVVMPNLSPQNVRKNYMLYNKKTGTELSAEESVEVLKGQMKSIDRETVTDRGDHVCFKRNGAEK